MTGEQFEKVAGRILSRLARSDPYDGYGDTRALIAEVRRLRGVVESVMEVALGRDGTAGADPRSQVELIRDRLAFEPDGGGEGGMPPAPLVPGELVTAGNNRMEVTRWHDGMPQPPIGTVADGPDERGFVRVRNEQQGRIIWFAAV